MSFTCQKETSDTSSSTHSENEWHSFVMSHSHLKHCWYLRSFLCQLTADPASCLLIWKMNYCLPLCSCTAGTDQRPAINCCCSSTFSSSLSQMKTWKWLHRGHLAPNIRVMERESDIYGAIYGAVCSTEKHHGADRLSHDTLVLQQEWLWYKY